jgi:hypothetical protein
MVPVGFDYCKMMLSLLDLLPIKADSFDEITKYQTTNHFV